MTEAKFTDDQMAAMARNALLIAGAEMGAEGDHWPVINATIHSVMRDWEHLKVARGVHEELRTQLYTQLEQMEVILKSSSDEMKAEVGPRLKRLREIYDAHFVSADDRGMTLPEDEKPDHVKRAQNILKTLEEDDGR